MALGSTSTTRAVITRGTAYTNINGYYKFEDLAPGSYRVRFDCAYYSLEWHHNAATFGTATGVTVNPGATTTIDEDLVYQFGALCGTVTDAVTGQPIEGIWVDVYELNEGLLASTLTDANGYYEFDSLAIGSYKLEFEEGAYHQGEWYHDAASFGDATKVTVTSRGTTTADEDLKPFVYITASAEPFEGGTVYGEGQYAHGTMVDMEAVPNPGYYFVNWTEDGVGEVSTDADYSFTAETDRTLVAHFAPNTYTITATADPVEGGTVTGDGPYNLGDMVTLHAMANTGYDFVNWTEDGVAEVSTEADHSFTADADRTLVAHFALKTYTITATADPVAGRHGDRHRSLQPRGHGDLHAVANTGYDFVNWTGTG